ncbi:MAG TPA: hypothetical protein VJ656_15195 [Pyrinomonadaceae bacterium]|nr:hypothetical protein [Pyrinomonadaceae bacterium]
MAFQTSLDAPDEDLYETHACHVLDHEDRLEVRDDHAIYNLYESLFCPHESRVDRDATLGAHGDQCDVARSLQQFRTQKSAITTTLRILSYSFQ